MLPQISACQLYGAPGYGTEGHRFESCRARSGKPRSGSIVVGVDGSRGAADALALGRGACAPLNARLVLVHAYEPSIALAPPTPDVRTEMRRLGADILESVRHALPPGVEVVEELAGGHTRPVLLAACERHGPAVLAVGSRVRGGVKGLRLGGTSRWVLDHAPLPGPHRPTPASRLSVSGSSFASVPAGTMPA